MRRVALAAAIVLAGCGGAATTAGKPETVTVTVTRSPEEDLPLASCTVRERGSDVRVRLNGPGADTACNRFVRELSGGGRFWSRQTRDFDPTAYDVYTVCTLVRRGLVMSVLDSGSARNGKAICGEFVGAGWTER